MTGWGAGPCAGRGGGMPAGRGWGRGLGSVRGGVRGAGGGRGWRHGFHATGLTGWQRAWTGWFGRAQNIPVGPSPEAELPTLREQAADLERTLDALKARIQEFEQPGGASASTPGKDDR